MLVELEKQETYRDLLTLLANSSIRMSYVLIPSSAIVTASHRVQKDAGSTPSVTKKCSELINYFNSKHRLTSNERREFKTRSLGTRHNGLSVYDLSDRILSGFHITIFKNLNLILKKLIWEQNYFRYLCSRARKGMKITQETIYHCYSPCEMFEQFKI